MSQSAGQGPRINELFAHMLSISASDLHLKAGNPPVFRVEGQLRRSKGGPLGAEKIDALVRDWIGERRLQEAKMRGSIDVGYDFPGGRVRVVVFMQRGRLSLVARLVKSRIPNLEDLHLPPVLSRLVDLRQGLVLLCGITGVGKSTTLACLLEMMNQKYAKHILTFEDPIEFIHEDKLSVINQREFGLDFSSWPDAIRSGVRADPDVMLVGEMRDAETCQHALVACETGHLVFSTMHTSSAATTVGRMLDLFPPDRHRLIRHSLSVNLQAVITQNLIPSYKPGVGRVPVMEVLFCNAPVRKAVDEGQDMLIAELISRGEQEGMQTWTKSFVDMVNGGFIEKKIARQYAPNRAALERALKGISLSSME